jgi:hypothetical protein
MHQFLAPFKKGLTPKKPLFATSWQKVLPPKTLAYCQRWQLLGRQEHGGGRGEVRFPPIIGNYCCITNSPLLRRIIAKLFNKWGEARFPRTPPCSCRPPCSFRELPILESFRKLIWIDNPPDNRRIITKLFYK